MQPMVPAEDLSSKRPPLDTEASDPPTFHSESIAVESPDPVAMSIPATASAKQDTLVVEVSSIRRNPSRFSLKF